MLIDRILFPINSLGPGNRVAIWTIGCPHLCTGCSNPELWSQDTAKPISVDQMMRVIKSISQQYIIDGFTITGGDPFFNQPELPELLKCISLVSDDIIVYTGYKYEDLLRTKTFLNCVEYISLLIDGPYIEKLNDNVAMRGSSNQNLICFRYEERYTSYMTGKRKIQNILQKDKMFSIGIPVRDFLKQIPSDLREKYGVNYEHVI